MNARRLGTVVLAAGLVLGVSACDGDDTQTQPAPAPTEDAQTEAPPVSPTEDEEQATTEPAAAAADDETEEPTEGETEGATDEEGAGGATAGDEELTEPGAELAVGEPAVIHLATVADPEDGYYRYLKLRATVSEIAEADPSLLDEVELSTPMPDAVPHLIWADLEILETDGDYAPTDFYPQIGAQHTDGSSAYTIFSSGRAIGECESEDFDELEVGATARMCVVALADEGEQIGGAVWGGNDNADGEGDWENNPYYREPVVWLD